MKILTSISALAVGFLASAALGSDMTAKITDVHLCCHSCVDRAEKAVSAVPGASASADQDSHTVTLTAPDRATLQKAADALIKAGYFGKTSDESIKLASDTGAADEKVQSLKIEGVHLCCPKCVKAVDHAVKTVPGVKEQTAVKGAKSFEVTGDFNAKDLMAALQKAGLTGKIVQ